MQLKKDVTVGVISKVREYYTSNVHLAGLIKVDRIELVERFGDEIHVYYKDISRHDRVFINGLEFIPKAEEAEQ